MKFRPLATLIDCGAVLLLGIMLVGYYIGLPIQKAYRMLRGKFA